MLENKELNAAQLENVSGGAWLETDPSAITWAHPLGETVVVHSGENFCDKQNGTIKKQGYWQHECCVACYYIECSQSGFGGWYTDEDIDTVVYTNKKMPESQLGQIVVVHE